MAILTGVLERVTFYNEENHYMIGRLRADESKNLVTVVGYLGRVGPGEGLKLTGRWDTHPKYGQQFKADMFEVVLPADLQGVARYLKSGIIKGIAQKTADRLLRHFGEKTLEIIEKDPGKLLDVEGIGKKTVSRIADSWKAHHEIRELMDFLHQFGLNVALCSKILKQYGGQAISMIQKSPYRLVFDIPEIDFAAADAIGNQLGFEKDDPERIKAGIEDQLKHFVGDGHTFIPCSMLMDRLKRLFRIDENAALHALNALDQTGVVVLDKDSGKDTEFVRVYPAALFKAETGIADRLQALLSVPVRPSEMDREKIVDELVKRIAIAPSLEQMDVLEGVLNHRVAVITGGPGTGKTTLIRAIAIIFNRLGKKILLAAPTGRAARRLSEVTQKKAETIHKMLRYNLATQTFDKDRDDPLDADAVIIDEASMVDTMLMFHLLNAVSMASRLILVGDIFQLPSIGPGNVLSDLIASTKIKAFELRKVFRQAHQSPIVAAAHRIRQGEMPDLQNDCADTPDSGFVFIEENHADALVDTIVKLCVQKNAGPLDLSRLNDIQIITPMHKGTAGTLNLNQVLQKFLNPAPKTGGRGPKGRFRINDKVMHLKNNYQKEVFNGDIGVICGIEPGDGKIWVAFDDRVVEYADDEMEDLTLAYAISVHKSQGSEYGSVILPMVTEHFALLQRNLLYTAVTRGKKLVVVIGTKKAIAIALNNDKPRQRLSALADKLKSKS
jgi:exodeoxyribonuclease V alpha subunit